MEVVEGLEGLEGLHERRERSTSDVDTGLEGAEEMDVEVVLGEEESGLLGDAGSYGSDGEWEVKWQLVWTALSCTIPMLLWLEDVATLFLQESCFTSTTCACDNLVLFSVFLVVLVCVGAVLAGLGAAQASRSLRGNGWSLREHARFTEAGEEMLGPFSSTTGPKVRSAVSWLDEQISSKKGFLESWAPTVIKMGLILAAFVPAVALISFYLLGTGVQRAVIFSFGVSATLFPFIVCAIAMLRKGMALTFLTFMCFAPIIAAIIVDVVLQTGSLWFTVALLGGCTAVIAAAWFFRTALSNWLKQGNAVLLARGRPVAIFMLALMPAGALFDSTNAPGRRHALLMSTSYAALAQFSVFLISVIVCAGFPLRTCLLTKELVAVALISCIVVACLALVNAVLRSLPHSRSNPQRNTSL